MAISSLNPKLAAPMNNRFDRSIATIFCWCSVILLNEHVQSYEAFLSFRTIKHERVLHTSYMHTRTGRAAVTVTTTAWVPQHWRIKWNTRTLILWLSLFFLIAFAVAVGIAHIRSVADWLAWPSRKYSRQYMHYSCVCTSSCDVRRRASHRTCQIRKQIIKS